MADKTPLGMEFANWQSLESGKGGKLKELIGLLAAGAGSPAAALGDAAGALGQGLSPSSGQFGFLGMQPGSGGLGMQPPANPFLTNFEMPAAVPPPGQNQFQLGAQTSNLPKLGQDLNNDGIIDFWGVKQ